MIIKIFIRSTLILFLSFLTIYSYGNYSSPQDTVKKNSAPESKEKLQQPLIISPGTGKPAGTLQDTTKQGLKKGPSVSPSQQIKTTDTNELKARELYFFGSRKGSQGDYEGAIVDLTEALSLHKDANTYLARALAYIKLENYQSAIGDLDEVIKFLPDNIKAVFNRGVCYYEMDDFEKAEADLTRSIEIDPKNHLVYTYKAAIKFKENDFQGALEDYTQVITLDSNNNQAFMNRGMIRHYLKDYQGAMEDFNQAIKLDPYNSTAYNNRGAVKMTLKDFASALNDFDAAIELKEDYADAYGNRGQARLNLGNTRGACEDLQNAYTLGMKGVIELITKYCK